MRRSVPLAIGLLCTSNPLVNVLDVLSKYSHDHDSGVAQSAIFAMGLVGAGTNNARLAQMLRQLAAYYYKEPNCLFVVRISQVCFMLKEDRLTFVPPWLNFLFFPCSPSPIFSIGVGSHGQRNNDAKSILR